MPDPRTSEFSAALPPAQLTRICEDVAQRIAGALLGQFNQVVEDMMRHCKNHGELVARQELLLREYSGQMTSAPAHQGASVFGCGLCQNDDAALENNGLSNRRALEQHVRGVDEAVPMASMEGITVEQQHWMGTADKRKRKGAPREVQQWVAEQLVAEQLVEVAGVPSAPQPSLPPPPPTETPRGYTSHKAIGKTVSINVQQDPHDIPTKQRDSDLSFGAMPSAVSFAQSTESISSTRHSVTSNAENPPLSRCTGDEAPDDNKRSSRETADSKNRASRTGRKSGAQSHQIQRHALFEDVGMDKSNLDQEEYTVTMYYWNTGYAQALARSDEFSNLTLGVICLNAIYIGYDADNNFKDNLLRADLQFIICEYLFCTFFFFEWTVRFLAFRRKVDGFKDMWFKFDTVLVAMMVVETWIFPVALAGGTGIPSGLVKLVRLLRLARMARIMRAFPDLVAMIKGVKVASRAVTSALLMLIGLIYVFSIIMFTILKDEPHQDVDDRFRKLGITMWTLLIDGTFLDGIGFVSRSLIETNHYFAVCVLIVFVLLSALTVMNMLIGVLCEVVAAVASAEKEDNAIRMVKTELLVLLKALDEDGSGMISRSEIGQVLEDETALSVLESLQVDISHLLDHLQMFFDHADGEELTIYQIMDLILMLRGDRPPTMKDMLHGQTFSRWKTGLALDEVKSLLMSVHSRVSFAPPAPH